MANVFPFLRVHSFLDAQQRMHIIGIPDHRRVSQGCAFHMLEASNIKGGEGLNSESRKEPAPREANVDAQGPQSSHSAAKSQQLCR